jgi:hypothetical protein
LSLWTTLLKVEEVKRTKLRAHEIEPKFIDIEMSQSGFYSDLH